MVIITAVWLLIGWLAGWLRPLDTSLGVELPRWAQIVGAVIVAIGAAGVLVCGVMLSTRGIGALGAGERFMPKEFLASGPFRFVRNPMSLAGITLMIGIALWHQSTLALGLAAALSALLHAVVVLVEEPGLKRRLGGSYLEYARHVSRWIPRLSPWRGCGTFYSTG
jgi:protein-S-isoprenylcysteine O-methyltransferase Ste14